MEYLSHFDFDICYVKGIKVVDALLHYYGSDTSEDVHGLNRYISKNNLRPREPGDTPSILGSLGPPRVTEAPSG